MKRYMIILLLTLPVFLILLPAALVHYFSAEEASNLPPGEQIGNRGAQKQQIPIQVYREEKQKIETVPLELYIEGVVSAEMPAEFELEALKAQAMAARTYIFKRLHEGNFSDVPKGAQVTDTVKHQAYMDDEQRKERWGEQYEWKSKKIQQAVNETAGIIVTYEGKPIDATFFATSNGFTENANEYWEKQIPYLRSVASPWDIESPRFEERVTLSIGELEEKLGVQVDTQAASSGAWYQVLDTTTGNRIGRIRIGGKEFSGREVREKLGLNSSSFTMRLTQNQVTITTRGYGHGVGMSQWGANGMAKNGNKAEQIVKYYYQGVTLQSYNQVKRS